MFLRRITDQEQLQEQNQQLKLRTLNKAAVPPVDPAEEAAYKAFYDSGGRLARIEYDSNGDGKPDYIAHHDGAMCLLSDPTLPGSRSFVATCRSSSRCWRRSDGPTAGGST